jgi:hypothetical protein
MPKGGAIAPCWAFSFGKSVKDRTAILAAFFFVLEGSLVEQSSLAFIPQSGHLME